LGQRRRQRKSALNPRGLRVAFEGLQTIQTGSDEQGTREETEIENDFQKKCRKGAKFAAHTAFSAILGEISCLFSLALEVFTRFRGGSFQPLTHLSGTTALRPQRKATANDQRLTAVSKERLQQLCRTSG
jgi:hypothetical protein